MTTDELIKANLYLFNMLFRHQVYLEGVKAGFAKNYAVVLNELYGEFAKFIGQTRYETLDGFTRVQLENFINRFVVAQQYFYSRYTQQLIGLLQQFVATDKDVLSAVYETATGLTTSQRSKSPEVGDLPSTLGLRVTHSTDAANSRLWNAISDEIVPASGLTIPQMFNDLQQSTTSGISKQLRIGYANGETGKATLASIVGDPELNYRDGLFARFANQNNAIIATAIQHATSMTNSAIASVHFNQYQWVSILDSRTTEICRSRNGNVYTYGDGPLPPAHYFCRSKDIPLNGDQLHDIPDTLAQWLTTQPEDVLVDMLGAKLAGRLASGSVGANTFSLNDIVIPLTLAQFASKIAFIRM